VGDRQHPCSLRLGGQQGRLPPFMDWHMWLGEQRVPCRAPLPACAHFCHTHTRLFLPPHGWRSARALCLCSAPLQITPRAPGAALRHHTHPHHAPTTHAHKKNATATPHAHRSVRAALTAGSLLAAAGCTQLRYLPLTAHSFCRRLLAFELLPARTTTTCCTRTYLRACLLPFTQCTTRLFYHAT